MSAGRKRKKRSREKSQLVLPSMAGFASPPSRAARERTEKREPPNQREAYDNSRVPADPEIMQFKELWVDSEELFRRDGLKGFIEVLKFDLDLEDYDREEKLEIKQIIANLNSKAVLTPVQLVDRVVGLVATGSDKVRTKVTDLVQEFARIANKAVWRKPESEDAKLRF